MNISQASEACGLPGKTIRYYEEIGLVVPRRQEGNDYRVYSGHEIAQLRLLQQARVAGFSLAECRELLALYVDPATHDSIGTRELVERKVTHIDRQLAALHVLRETLLAMDRSGRRDSDVEAPSLANDEAVPSGMAMAFRLVDDGNKG